MTPTKAQMDSLVERGLATVKHKDGLNLYKYHRKVFYNNLWHLDPALLECRGIVFADDGELVQLPFRKVFNVGENGTTLDDNTSYLVSRKVNGFMAAVTWYNGNILVTTTGSFDSDFVQLAKKHLPKDLDATALDGRTVIYEICDVSDPHIVKEVEGAYMLGGRDKTTGVLYLPFGAIENTICPETLRGDVVKQVIKWCNHEGYVIYDLRGNPVAKLKSPHYLSKKALIRLGKAQVDVLYDNTQVFLQRLDEEFYDIAKYIVNNVDKEDWRSASPQQRKEFIESYFNVEDV